MVAIHEVPLAEVSHYGILTGTWEDKSETVLNISQMNEKPKASYAEEFLGVKGKDGQRKYWSVFGQYIITPEVFEQLQKDIVEAGESDTEIEMTTALDKVRKHFGMVGIRLKGQMFDIGNYAAFGQCVANYSK